jgi:hypothetical protein
MFSSLNLYIRRAFQSSEKMRLTKKAANAGIVTLSALTLWLGLELGAQKRVIYCDNKVEEHGKIAVHYMSSDIQKWRNERAIAESYGQKRDYYANLIQKYGPVTNLRRGLEKIILHNYQK